jgi:iron(III) transport system substrate-binding protein
MYAKKLTQLLFVAFLLNTGWSSLAGAAGEEMVTRKSGESADAYIKRLYDAAKKEKEVIYYHSANKSEVEAIRKGWNKLFPGIKLTEVEASSGTILERALVEGRAGRVKADVYGGAAGDQDALAAEKLSAVYRSVNLDALDPNFRFEGKPYVATGYLSFHIAYNTKMVSKSEMPNKWEGFLDPKWKGKLAIDQEGHEWFCGITTHMGKEKGLDFMRKLAAQNPKLIRGSTHRTELLSAGSFPIALDLYGHRIKTFKDKGSPIDTLVPHPAPITTVVDMASVMNGAPHPNAGRLLLEFFLTPEGQQVFLMQGKPGVRVKDVKHPYEELIRGSKLEVLAPETADFNQCGRDFVNVFIRKR